MKSYQDISLIPVSVNGYGQRTSLWSISMTTASGVCRAYLLWTAHTCDCLAHVTRIAFVTENHLSKLLWIWKVGMPVGKSGAVR